jgi:hypothetical protein
MRSCCIQPEFVIVKGDARQHHVVGMSLYSIETSSKTTARSRASSVTCPEHVRIINRAAALHGEQVVPDPSLLLRARPIDVGWEGRETSGRRRWTGSWWRCGGSQDAHLSQVQRAFLASEHNGHKAPGDTTGNENAAGVLRCNLFTALHCWQRMCTC